MSTLCRVWDWRRAILRIITAAINSQENSRLQVKSGVDLVTETDKAAEKAIIERLRASHPVRDGGARSYVRTTHEVPGGCRPLVLVAHFQERIGSVEPLASPPSSHEKTQNNDSLETPNVLDECISLRYPQLEHPNSVSFVATSMFQQTMALLALLHRCPSPIFSSSSCIFSLHASACVCNAHIHVLVGRKDHHFVGEETTFAETGAAGARGVESIGLSPVWIIDPLDGTTNFVSTVHRNWGPRHGCAL